jgi:hypothetical protein
MPPVNCMPIQQQNYRIVCGVPNIVCHVVSKPHYNIVIT